MASPPMIKRITKITQKRLGRPLQNYKLKGPISLLNTPQKKLRCQENLKLYLEGNLPVKRFHDMDVFESFCRMADELLIDNDNDLPENCSRLTEKADNLFSDDKDLLIKDSQPKAEEDNIWMTTSCITLNVDGDEGEEFFKAWLRSAKKFPAPKLLMDSGSMGVLLTKEKEFESNPSKKIICIEPKPLGESKANVVEIKHNKQEKPDIIPNPPEKLMDPLEKKSEKQEEGKSKIGMQGIKDFRFSFFNPVKSMPQSNKRNIIIDGSNVAFAHGKNCFSSKGLEYCLEYFIHRGHYVKAIVPLFRRNAFQSTDPMILDKLYKKGNIVFTPCKNISGQRLVSYDDCFVLQLVYEWNAAVLSNDNYRDLMDEGLAIKMIVQNRVLSYTWRDDTFIPVKDPYGYSGPTVDEILHF